LVFHEVDDDENKEEEEDDDDNEDDDDKEEDDNDNNEDNEEDEEDDIIGSLDSFDSKVFVYILGVNRHLNLSTEDALESPTRFL